MLFINKNFEDYDFLQNAKFNMLIFSKFRNASTVYNSFIRYVKFVPSSNQVRTKRINHNHFHRRFHALIDFLLRNIYTWYLSIKLIDL